MILMLTIFIISIQTPHDFIEFNPGCEISRVRLINAQGLEVSTKLK
jgi:hypothetical protein